MLIGMLSEFRELRLDKRPGISEAIDAAALLAYPRDAQPTPLAERLPLAAPALAKLRNDRAQLAALIESVIAEQAIQRG